MLTHYKALLVVLVLTTIVFVLAKPLCLRFTAPEDFARRRMVWYVLTITGFVSPSFWLYALIAAPLVWHAARRDSAPMALFALLIFVLPPVDIDIPVVGIGRLFEMSNWRLFALVILLPAVLARRLSSDRSDSMGLNGVDALLLAYGALQIVQLIPYESITNTVRRAVEFLWDIFLIYFAFSRLVRRKSELTDVLGALCLAAAISAPIAVFESVRGWLLYTDIGDIWGSPNVFAWLLRGDLVRAQAATGNPLTLGYLMALAIGFWMYLKSLGPARSTDLIAFVWFAAGLLVSYSRGAWVSAVVLVLIFMMLSSTRAATLFKGTLVFAAFAGVVLATPVGPVIIENLPFVGNQDQDTVAYRQQLAEISWELVQRNPFFGNPFVLLDMEEMRQGQGIIDLVNAYAQVALFYGLVGLALFAGVFTWALFKAFGRLRLARADADIALQRLGASLIAAMVSNLFFIATAGQGWPQFVLAGLLCSYARLAPERNAAPQNPSTQLTTFRSPGAPAL